MSSTDAAEAIRQRVRHFVREHHLLADVDRVLVGFSGGADSTALLLLMSELSADVVAVHLHHGLRGADADCDAEWCREFCAARTIQFECHRLDVPRHQRSGENVESTGRRLRLAFWRGRADSRTVVALGHHADDALEDLFIRLVRGSNASGLTGLRPERVLTGVRTVRPLLCLRRNEIEGFLKLCGIQDWRVDRTNRDTSLRRNAVRHEWLPLIRRTVGHDAGLCRALDALRLDADYLESAARGVVDDVGDAEKLRQLHPALLPRALRLWLADRTGSDLVVGCSALERLRAELARRPVRPVEIPISGGIVLVLSHDKLALKHEEMKLQTRPWHWRREPVLELPEVDSTLEASLEPIPSGGPVDVAAAEEWFCASDLPDSVAVRAWEPGDWIVSFGSRSRRKLQDVFVDRHVPREQRHALPVIVAGDRIIWVAGVLRAEFGRVAFGQVAEAVRMRWHPGGRNEACS